MDQRVRKGSGSQVIRKAKGKANNGGDGGDGDVSPGVRIKAWVDQRYGTFGKRGAVSLRAPDPQAYLHTLKAWRNQRALGTHLRPGGLPPPSPPVPAPGVNWVPIGPSVVRRGQAGSAPPVSGRAVDVAIAPGGARVYLATANGGVWRSDDGGATWRSTMDNVDLSPTYVDADSQACGAVAIDPNNPDRVYVGTGEGDSSYFFYTAFGPLGVIYAYAGVGPLRSDTGGNGGWVTEPVAPASPTLVGQAFFALAVDPTDAERVVGATTGGIYRRQPDGSGGYQWAQTRAGNCSSVVVARASGMASVWFAAMRGGPVLTSPDGSTWTTLGTGFPAGVTRVTLAVQPSNPGTVYAFSSAGVHRIDLANGRWLPVTTAATVDGGEYGAALAIDPTNVNLIYIGSYGGAGSGANILRASVTSTGSGGTLAYSASTTLLGGTVHPDVHRLVVRADASDELWATCDGGTFRTTTASTAATFEPRNVGLATLLCTYLDNHPTEAAVVFCGAQDNGTLRYTGEEAWLHSADGDGGPVVINWNDPYQVLRTYVYGSLDRATDGGASTGSWANVSPGASGALFYPPLVGAPNDGTAADAGRVALGADRTWFSDTFGTGWSTPDTGALNGVVSALVYTTASRVYAGTTTGRVYVYNRSSTTWSAGTLVGQVGGGAAGLAPIVTSIVADPADATGTAIYLTLGGVGDYRRVWRYDGTSWAARCGPSAGAATSLLAVNFNTLAADPLNTGTLFAGADIGVWRSTDGGQNWFAFADGLPEAGISHLKLQPTHRLLRAALYGRGVYERDIDAVSAPAVELYTRDTDLDVARWPTVDWLPDPESGVTPHAQVMHWESPNIKVDPPSSAGTYQTSKAIDFFQFVDQLVDGSEGVATIDASAGTAVNRVFVEVHNRGLTQADGVQVMLLLANASAGLSAAPLPSGYAASVQAGTAINTASWQTVGIQTLNGVRVGAPQVVEFSLPSTMLPPPTSLPAQSHYCLLSVLHHPQDSFNNTLTNADELTVADRKVAQRNLQIVNFTGTLPPPGTGITPLGAQSMLIDLFANGREVDIVLDARNLRGAATLLLPKNLGADVTEATVVGGKVLRAGHLDRNLKPLERLVNDARARSRASARWSERAEHKLHELAGGTPVRFVPGGKRPYMGVRNVPLSRPATALLVLEPPKDATLGDRWEFTLMLVDRAGRITGGSTYKCRVVLPPDDEECLQIHARVEEGRGHRHLEVQLSAGRPIPSHGSCRVYAAEFTAFGLAAAPVALDWDDKRDAFWLDLDRSQDQPPLRRITIVARHGEHEGRKTVELTPG